MLVLVVAIVLLAIVFIEEELTGICGKCYDGANFEDLYGEDQ